MPENVFTPSRNLSRSPVRVAGGWTVTEAARVANELRGEGPQAGSGEGEGGSSGFDGDTSFYTGTNRELGGELDEAQEMVAARLDEQRERRERIARDRDAVAMRLARVEEMQRELEELLRENEREERELAAATLAARTAEMRLNATPRPSAPSIRIVPGGTNPHNPFHTPAPLRTRLSAQTPAAPATSVRFSAGPSVAAGRSVEAHAVDMSGLRSDMAKMGKLAREGPQFVGKIADTPTRELRELETRILRKFELYEVSVDDQNLGVQRCILSAVESFLKVGGPAHKMYEDHVATWETYDDFIGRLFLTFQQPDAEQEVIRAWNASKQGNRLFMDWVTELERIWVALNGVMGRAMFALKLQEDAHPKLLQKLAERGQEFEEAELITHLQRLDVWRLKEGKGRGEADSSAGGFARLPKEQWELVKSRADAAVRRQVLKEMGGANPPANAPPPAAAAAGNRGTPGGGAPRERDSAPRKAGESEKDYRYRAGLCLRCGRPGHSRRTCTEPATVAATRAAEVEGKRDEKLGEAAAAKVVDLPESVAPTVRFVPGGHSYADAAAAWRDGRVLAKKDKSSPALATTGKGKVEVEGVPKAVRFNIPPPADDEDTRIASGSAAVANAKPIADDKDKTCGDDLPRQQDDPSSEGSGTAADEPTATDDGQPRTAEDWKDVVGGPDELGAVFTVVATVGGHPGTFLVDPASNICTLDSRFVALHRLGRLDHPKRRKIGTGFKGSFGTSAAATVQPVELGGAGKRRVYFEVCAVDGYDGILGTLWLGDRGLAQCWQTGRLVSGGKLVGGVDIPTAQMDRRVRAIATADGSAAITEEMITRTIRLSQDGPLRFAAWDAASETLGRLEGNGELTKEAARAIVEKFGVDIGILRLDGTLPPGLPPLREGLNHVSKMKAGDLPPIPKRAVRYPLKYAEQMREKEAQYLRDGRWYPSMDAEAIPTFVVPKKNPAKGRLVFDERARNRQREIIRASLPNTDDIRDAVQRAVHASQFDIIVAYEQFRLDPDSEKFSSFLTPNGQRRSRVLSMGDVNGPVTFQRAADVTAGPKLGKTVRPYLDNFVVVTDGTLREHAEECLWMLARFLECEWYIGTMEFVPGKMDVLGSLIGKGVRLPGTKVIKTILDVPTPTCIADVDRMLGAFNFVSEHSFDSTAARSVLADVVKHRTVRGKKGTARPAAFNMDGAFAWTPTHQAAWDKMLVEMQHALELRAFDAEAEDLRTYLITDASLVGIAGYLAQGPVDGTWKDSWPIRCWSRSYGSGERNYTTTAQEKLAVVESLSHYEHYLRGMDFTICTDHEALIPQGMGSSVPVGDRVDARQNVYLASFAPTWLHIPGHENVLADALSRIWEGYRVEDAGNVELDDADEDSAAWRWSALNGAAGLGASGSADGDVEGDGAMVRATAAVVDEDPADEPAAAIAGELDAFFGEGFTAALEGSYRADSRWGPVWEEPDLHAGYSRAGGVLLLDGERTVIPPGLEWKGRLVREQLVEHAHLELVHAGGNTCFEYLRRSFYWRGMWGDVKGYAKACDRCARTKSRSGKEPGVAMGMAVAGRLGAHLAMDFVGPFPVNEHGDVKADMIWHVMDRPSGKSMFLPWMSTGTAEDLATLWLQRVYPRWGVAASILSDRDTKFLSRFWVSAMGRLPVKLRRTTSFRPQTDGQVERRHKDIGESLQALVDGSQERWLAALPLVEFRCNASHSRTTDTSPFEHTIGFIPTSLPAIGPIANSQDWASWLKDLDAGRRAADDAVREAKVDQVLAANAGRKDTPVYSAGDKVLLSTKNLRFKNEGSRKLRDRWTGPFVVREQQGLTVYLELPAHWKLFPKFHVSLVKRYEGKADSFPGSLPDLDEDGTPEWEVEKILAHRWNGRRKTWEFKIRWFGYSPVEDSWEPEVHLDGSRETLDDYLVAKKLALSADARSAGTKRNSRK